jgi:hypothetical protein
VAERPAQVRIGAMLRPLIGATIPGGCDDCDAYQTVEEAAPSMFLVHVHHDDRCPVLRRYQRAP